jgi:hypothetical protein
MGAKSGSLFDMTVEPSALLPSLIRHNPSLLWERPSLFRVRPFPVNRITGKGSVKYLNLNRYLAQKSPKKAQ